ncbi:hypothetical protein FXE78_11390 [Vibrio mimicus]|nr:hypothetical protein [Vibrio cholerae]MCA3912487.1 hypothetical protein [Vibrio vulnificus]TXY46151.1 hypothetical protein FXE78_11175 [Vibrio mimicus]TXY46159.1 hypothetical protein FXE78_11390 [Vibrio mimicus]
MAFDVCLCDVFA